MLPTSHCNSYEEFLAALEQLQQTVSLTNPIDKTTLEKSFPQVQQLFFGKILNLSNEDLAPATASELQSYLTEIHRQMRLLQMDVLFLQASRQVTTANSRQATISDRIKMLINYSQRILAISN